MLSNTERPKTFDEMVEQQLVVQNIRNQSIRDRFFPVYVLCGQYGSGKTTMARLIAMAINCQHKDERGNPCLTCESCKAVLNGRPEGAIEIDGASHNKVEDIRRLLSQAETLGIFAKKVFIVDEVHMLSKSAFNALLKTLEEPPKHCVFILCTTEKEAIPDTILSRAPVYEITKISDACIKEHILKTAQKHGMRVTSDAAGLIARHSDGAMRNALQLLDYLYMQKDGEKITDADVIETLGLSTTEQKEQFIVACLDGEIASAIEILKSCEYGGISLKTFIKDVLSMNMDILLAGAGKKIVGTTQYQASIQKLCALGTGRILALSPILNKIGEIPANLLSSERVVVDMIAGLELHKGLEQSGKEPIERAEKEIAELPSKEPVQKAEEKQEVNASELGFQELDTDCPFEETMSEEDFENLDLTDGLFGGFGFSDLFGSKEGIFTCTSSKTSEKTEKEMKEEKADLVEDRIAKESLMEGGEEKTSPTGPDKEPLNIPSEESVAEEQEKTPMKEGAITWEEMASNGIVPSEIQIPVPETDEELAEEYERIEEKREEEQEVSNRLMRGNKMDSAKEALQNLLKNPGFGMLYKKARIEEGNGKIVLIFDRVTYVKAANVFLKSEPDISAVMEI